MDETEEYFSDTAYLPDEREVRAFLQAFYHWFENAASPVQQCARSRVLLLCLLIRFAALRLGEALALNDMTGIDAEAGVLHVPGRRARVLPLPESAMKRLLELRDAPCNVRARGELCRLDPAYVRRVFARRAEEAGLPGISPTDIRNFREQELLRHGVPLPTVEFFLGRRGGGVPKPGEVAHLREAFRQWEYASQTGRHNIVSGALTLLRKGDFSCLLEVTTAAGTAFAVRCSTRTFARLELADQKEARVSVRSLQVQVLPEKLEAPNCMSGTIVDILERGDEARVMIGLTEDTQQFCAILPLSRVRELDLKQGGRIWILIRPEDFTFCGTARSGCLHP